MNLKETIITGAVERIRTGVVASMQSYDRIATGDTVREMKTVTTADGARLEAPHYISLLETGRPPTGNPPKVPGSYLERIKEWCRAKGIDEGASWAIKRKIDREGYDGKPGVLSQPLSNPVVDPIIEEAINKVTLIITTEVLAEIKI